MTIIFAQSQRLCFRQIFWLYTLMNVVISVWGTFKIPTIRHSLQMGFGMAYAHYVLVWHYIHKSKNISYCRFPFISSEFKVADKTRQYLGLNIFPLSKNAKTVTDTNPTFQRSWPVKSVLFQVIWSTIVAF
jgi:hypothetical protein